MEHLNKWLEHWEATWLFVLIFAELVVGVYSGVILTIEYKYDKAFNEQLKAAKRESRRKKYEFESLTDGEGR